MSLSARRITSAVRRALRFVESAILPMRCVCCDNVLPWNTPYGKPFCPSCGLPVPITGGERCRKCSRPLISEIDLCTRCRARGPDFDSHFSAYRYRGLARDALRAYKFRGCRELCHLFAHVLGVYVAANHANLPLVPVPARRASVAQRGYDPVLVLARELARSCDTKVLRLLSRNGGKSQKTLNYADRMENLRGRIRVRSRLVKRIGREGPPPRVLLVDDVMTTGATASECARVLKAAGVREVSIVTVAMD